jgi:hypothetical protein
VFSIEDEMSYQVKARQPYRLSTWSASRISQRKVRFTNASEKDLFLECLRNMFSDVARIWLVPHAPDLEDNVQDLVEMVTKLDNSEIKLTQKVIK